MTKKEYTNKHHDKVYLFIALATVATVIALVINEFVVYLVGLWK